MTASDDEAKSEEAIVEIRDDAEVKRTQREREEHQDYLGVIATLDSLAWADEQ